MKHGDIWLYNPATWVSNEANFTSLSGAIFKRDVDTDPQIGVGHHYVCAPLDALDLQNYYYARVMHSKSSLITRRLLVD